MDHSSSFLDLVNDAKTRIKEISPQKLFALLEENEKLVLLDVREADEWFSGHLPRALHLPRGLLERDVEKLIHDKKTAIVTYCAGGYRSALAADNLMKMGYKNVLSLKGGVKEWRLNKLPLIVE